MPCYNPRDAYRGGILPSGKLSVVFKNKQSTKGRELLDWLKVPCGLCIGCRLDRSRDWALRCMHENSLQERNSFITLTYSDAFLPEEGNLQKSHFQKFMKRLRKKIHGSSKSSIRYYYCGEYGEKFSRPHYHAIIFGYDFPDKTLWSKKRGSRLYRSDLLEELWPFGQSLIGDVTLNSAAYVARYILKKQFGPGAQSHYEYLDEYGEYKTRTKEFTDMSRRPGIARGWFEKFSSDCYPKDYVTFNGKEFKPPRYYDRIFELAQPSDFATIKAKRKNDAIDLEVETWERLKTRERVALLNSKNLERGFEK